MNANQIPSPVQLGQTNIDREETPSSVDNYSWLDEIQRLNTFFRSATPALPLSNTNRIPVISGGQNIPLKPLPSHQQIRRRPTRGRSRCLTAERTSDQVTEGIHRHRSISPWTGRVLLCWGDNDRCHIIPADIRDEADEVNVWESIKTAYKSKAGYVGLYRELAIERRTVDCFTNNCIPCMDYMTECPERRFYKSQRQLLRLTRRPLLTQAFSNRNVAKVDNLLKEEELI
ncbi:uncharacterized protein BDW70DRAFT_148930 [Aspergillus foveolatus]|uniref:uncharacterized protein n=1 Tax=Aspergillus foveolatus TaxID=210207 RepID=UPI003CCD4135